MQKKIFLNLYYVLLIGIVISGLLSYTTIESTYNKGVEDKLISNAYLTAEIIAQRLNEHGYDNINDYIKKIKTSDEIRITLIDTEGTVLADTYEDPSKMENHRERSEVKKAINGLSALEKRYSSTIKANYLYYALPVKSGIENSYIVRLSMPLKDIEAIKKRYLSNLLIAFGFGLAIALIIGYNTSKRITKPLSQITQMSEEISKGKFDLKLAVEGKDEIAKLAGSINNMAEQLQYYINGLNRRNEEMEAILGSVINGIIAIDNNQRILFINKYAKKLLNIEDEDLKGQYLIYALRNHQINQYLKNSIENKKFEETEVMLSYPQERNIKLYTNPIMGHEGTNTIGIIITLQDVTQIRKLERIKSEFVANVSHELKTPLTSIKGFIETLKEGAVKDENTALKFLNIIDYEAERLTNLITDILVLSELENKKEKTAQEKFSIETSIDEVIMIFKSQAEKKNIKIEKNIEEDIGFLFGPRDKFKQMIINLIDNAIKYSGENSKVMIEALVEDERKVISIQDFGIGIPEGSIPRIFERFYRVDKARSKAIYGGTGLGLSIVKHIAISFGAEISVESQPGKGTKFKIKFPLVRKES
ncbi:two-component system histidine kinase PnpS [Lutispora saccharofermentans]|uniref:histidine kinase n=1 Tax=Lutispora saccharofermentans TaxID=3024236 RepID=A0ABT1NCQ1_9FIRM|nr:ATP-binding protein [Lutispora saccharofermentans]MCQ1528111.1 cell wall metabolism sensor histidine kinase WalK [Lutispora saccharofermentans]